MPTPTEYDWRAWAALKSAVARLQGYGETTLNNVLDENLEWAAWHGIDEVMTVANQAAGQCNDAAQAALNKAEALLVAIRVIALANPRIDIPARERAETVIALWYMLKDLAGDEDEPLRWAERDAQRAKKIAARRAGAA